MSHWLHSKRSTSEQESIRAGILLHYLCSVEREGADEMRRYDSVFSMSSIGLEGDKRGRADQQEGRSGISVRNPRNRIIIKKVVSRRQKMPFLATLRNKVLTLPLLTQSPCFCIESKLYYRGFRHTSEKQ